MLASQLLRILQTIPSDVQHETSVYDSVEQDMMMNGITQNGTINHDSRSFGREADPLVFQSKEINPLNGRDERWNAKFVDDLSADIQNGNNLVEKDNNSFTDKIVLQCDKPPSIVCYKEINYHVVKDICIDDGMPVNNKISIDSSKDHDDCLSEAIGPFDEEQLLSDGLATSLENRKGVSVNEHGGKEVIDGMLLVQGGPKLPLESSLDKDSAGDCSPEDSAQRNETNFGATYASKEESFVDKTLPIKEFGTRSFLRSFLNSLDGEENSIKQLPDQNSYGKVVSRCSAPSAEDAGPKEDVQPSSLSYNSKVETENIMFDFKSPTPWVGGDTNETNTGNVKEPSADVIDQKDADADNLSDANVHSESSSENDHDQSLGHKNENPIDLSPNGPLQFSISQSINSINSDGETVNSHVSKHDELKDPDNDSVASLRRFDVGESSFSGTGLVSYSGPISFSGSLSLRSDGSATSGRSFAFPVLQPEWSSSPERMTKAERRHFRKHKGWRSGLLCCRF